MHRLHHLIIQPEHFHNCMMAQHSDSHISFQETFCTAIRILYNIFVLPCYSLRIFQKTDLQWMAHRIMGFCHQRKHYIAPWTGWWMRKRKMNTYIHTVSWVLLCLTHKYTLLCFRITKDICGTVSQLERERERELKYAFWMMHMVCKQHYWLSLINDCIINDNFSCSIN